MPLTLAVSATPSPFLLLSSLSETLTGCFVSWLEYVASCFPDCSFVFFGSLLGSGYPRLVCCLRFKENDRGMLVTEKARR